MSTERTDLLRAWWKSVLARNPLPPDQRKADMTVTTFPDVMQDMADTTFRQQVSIVAETQLRHAPWLFDEEAWDKSRLKGAIELVCEGKVHEMPDGWLVKGSGSVVYTLPRVTLACLCKAAQHGKSSVCKHRVAVELAKRVHQAYPQEAPLPFGPVTVEERLALSTMHDNTALSAHHVPQEDRMADDDAHYIPEPEEAPVAVLDAPEATCANCHGYTTPRHPVSREACGHTLCAFCVKDGCPLCAARTSPALRPRTPQVDDLEAALQIWTTERAVVQRFLKQELKANIDYYTLRIGGKDSKPSLSKAGAEKVMGWLKIQASFSPDTGTWEMLGRPQDLVMYICTLRTRSGEIVGEGRGARSIKKDNGDINKAIKMAEKSACVSAVLRTGALSDVFTCDLEDMQEEPVKAAKPNPLHPSADLRQRIWARLKEIDPGVSTRDEVERRILERTGLALVPDNYANILDKIGEVGQ
jgi:hypothetical protein